MTSLPTKFWTWTAALAMIYNFKLLHTNLIKLNKILKWDYLCEGNSKRDELNLIDNWEEWFVINIIRNKR